jgi:hypothetical protein
MKPELLTEQEVTDCLNPLAGWPEPGELEVSAAALQPYWAGSPMVSLQLLALLSSDFSTDLFIPLVLFWVSR